MTGYHLAQFNVALLINSLDDPSTDDFRALLDPVNSLADRAPGFVWRLVADGEPDALSIQPYGPGTIINYSVWESRQALWDFAYRSGHLDVMRRRREWFHRHVRAHLVLWWIPAGHIPDVPEAVRRLELLREVGPSPEAFTFREEYPPPGPQASEATAGPDSNAAACRPAAADARK